MGKKGREKRPGAEFTPSSDKIIRGGRAPDAIPTMPFRWSTVRMDWGGPFSWSGLSAERILREIIPKLQDFEKMTWGEIEGPSGSHFVDVTALVKPARKRLKEIGMEDTDQIFSLRMGARPRIWGIRDVAVLQIIWWDPEHAVCPSQKKGT
jgi:hypothetical protein